jgi:hypothetical protein
LLHRKKQKTKNRLVIQSCCCFKLALQLTSDFSLLICKSLFSSWAGGVTPAIDHLPGKCKALSSNPSTAKKNLSSSYCIIITTLSPPQDLFDEVSHIMNLMDHKPCLVHSGRVPSGLLAGDTGVGRKVQVCSLLEMCHMGHLSCCVTSGVCLGVFQATYRVCTEKAPLFGEGRET